MVKKRVIEMTEEELERDRQRVAKQAAEAAIKHMGDVVDRVMSYKAYLDIGVADKQMLADIFEISIRQVERLDEEHNFQRVKGPTRDRNWYDVEDVKRKLKSGQ